MTINRLKERDKRLIKETGIKVLARLVGYNEVGETVEIVYNSRNNMYEWHIGGEYKNEVSQESIVLFFKTKESLGTE